MVLRLAAMPGIFTGADSLKSSPWHTGAGQAGFVGCAIRLVIWCLRSYHLLRTT